jgi:hypothetical protein
MHTTATGHGVEPDRISFTRALHAARRSVRAGLGAATETLAVALPQTSPKSPTCFCPSAGYPPPPAPSNAR